jgi:hypothetical protein
MVASFLLDEHCIGFKSQRFNVVIDMLLESIGLYNYQSANEHRNLFMRFLRKGRDLPDESAGYVQYFKQQGFQIVNAYIEELSLAPDGDLRELLVDVLVALVKYFQHEAGAWVVEAI